MLIAVAEILEQQIQLVVTDCSPLAQNLKGGIYSTRIWRFADFSTRLDYLLAGFRVVPHAVAYGSRAHSQWAAQAAADQSEEGFTMAIHVVRQRGTRLGPASRWLIEDVRKRLANWEPCAGSGKTKRAARRRLA